MSGTLNRVALHHLDAFLRRRVHPPRGLLGWLGRLIAFTGGSRRQFRPA